MAEIRVRDADPQLIKQLELIGQELNEKTIAGLLTKLIPRYHNQKKSIIELKNEIAATVRERDKAQAMLSDAEDALHWAIDQCKSFEKTVNAQTRNLTVYFKQLQNAGTKKRRQPGRTSSRKGKNVPTKKKRK